MEAFNSAVKRLGRDSVTRLLMRGATLPLLTCIVMACTGTVLPFHAKEEVPKILVALLCGFNVTRRIDTRRD